MEGQCESGGSLPLCGSQLHPRYGLILPVQTCVIDYTGKQDRAMGSRVVSIIRRSRQKMRPSPLCPFHCASFTVTRQLHCTPVHSTDGVYRDLTNMRVRTPWIEALRRKRKEEEASNEGPAVPPPSPSHVLKAKKMSDSFHRVVSWSSCPYS